MRRWSMGGPVGPLYGPETDWADHIMGSVVKVIELEAERCSLDSLGAFTDER
jgi:hypothetical protein